MSALGIVRDERVDGRIGSDGRTVRWSELGFEMQCIRCREFWPLTEEFWYPVRGLATCRACKREVTCDQVRRLRSLPEIKREHRLRLRAERRARARRAIYGKPTGRDRVAV